MCPGLGPAAFPAAASFPVVASGLRPPRGQVGLAGLSAPRLLTPRRKEAGVNDARWPPPHCGNAAAALGAGQPGALPYPGAPPRCGNWNYADMPPSLLPDLTVTGVFPSSKP